MWGLAGVVGVTLLMAAWSTPAASGMSLISEPSPSQEIRNQLTPSSSVLRERRFVQNTLNGSRPEVHKGDINAMQQMANQIVEALREHGVKNKDNSFNSSSHSNSILSQILDELKKINKHFLNQVLNQACPAPFVMIGNECFHVILDDVSWSDARAKCIQMGSDLAQPLNINELKVHVGETYPRKERRNFWIGGVNKEKVWQWLAGEPLPEGYWHTNEPSGNGECLALFDGWVNPFTDFPCASERRAICQRKISEGTR